MKEKKTFLFGLIGNPNSGKSSIFNSLTDKQNHIANYPGVTIEKKEGYLKSSPQKVKIVDLPGIYSLTTYSEDERVTRDFILKEKPDYLINVLDSSNLERHLYLTVQLMEMGIPLILVLNMEDICIQNGIQIDKEQLSKWLNVPVIAAVGNQGKGLKQIKEAILSVLISNPEAKYPIHYGQELEEEISLLKEHLPLEIKNPHWVSLKLLEQDEEVQKNFQTKTLSTRLEESRQKLATVYGDDPRIMIADKRYGFISGIYHQIVKHNPPERYNLSDAIDRFLAHQWIGVLFFLGIMYGTFYLTFHLGEYPMKGMEFLFKSLSDLLIQHWPEALPRFLQSLMTEGIIGGVGGVLIFLPNIFFLFFLIALLEDTGYMARAAFVLDKHMQKIGLHGKSFIPMLLGFGCTVPAIMATRILENKRDRVITMLILPLISCGARFPIYALIIPAFFPKSLQGPLLWFIYLLGILLAAVLAKILGNLLFKSAPLPLIMELPPYRMPTFKCLFSHVWMRVWLYLKKAGTVIFGFSILFWLLTSFSLPDSSLKFKKTTLNESIAGQVGHLLEPALKPLGFDWKIATALIGTLPAKELFVSQMGILFSVEEEENHVPKTLREKLRSNYSPLVAFNILIFCLIACPCISTVIITYKESNSWKYCGLQFFGLTILAYLICLLVFQIGITFAK